MCDASGAVALSASVFVVADDEDNVLRAYDADRGGEPLWSVDVSAGLRLPEKKKKKKKKAGQAPETDIEAATRLGDLALWLTSHGRNRSGKRKTERLRFFATTTDPKSLRIVGQPYEGLLDDLISSPQMARFDLAAASLKAPKDAGGLNIEGMTARPDGTIIIGLRNPLPEGRAIVVPIMNPREVVTGKHARFGEAMLLDLGGLGVRGLSFWRGDYLILAGPYDRGADSVLYRWDGKTTPTRLAVDLSGGNPEAFFTPDARDQILLLSDDGTTDRGGVECKRLKDTSQKRFRGAWVTVPD